MKVIFKVTKLIDPFFINLDIELNTVLSGYLSLDKTRIIYTDSYKKKWIFIPGVTCEFVHGEICPGEWQQEIIFLLKDKSQIEAFCHNNNCGFYFSKTKETYYVRTISAGSSTERERNAISGYVIGANKNIRKLLIAIVESKLFLYATVTTEQLKAY